MIHAILDLNKKPDYKDFKNELDFFDDIYFTDKNQILLRYNPVHGADTVFNVEYNMSVGEMRAIKLLGRISRKHQIKITFWA